MKQDELKCRYGGSKKEVYQHLKSLHIYLPPYNCPAVNREYLRAVRSGLVFTISKADKKKYPYSAASKEVVYCAFKEVAQSRGLEAGFTIANLPPKSWMLTVLFSEQPSHELFIQENLLEDLRDKWDTKYRTRCLWACIRDYVDKDKLNAEYRLKILDEYNSELRSRINALKNEYPLLTTDISKLDTN